MTGLTLLANRGQWESGEQLPKQRGEARGAGGRPGTAGQPGVEADEIGSGGGEPVLQLRLGEARVPCPMEEGRTRCESNPSAPARLACSA